jgi:8-oxo-dGTP pyrophosphatase MutT (NUDIX family)
MGSAPENPNADWAELARRELREETGLIAKDLQWLGHLYEASGFSSVGFNVILARGLTRGEAEPEPDEQGIITRWFSEAEVWDLVTRGVLKDAPTVAALGLFQRMLHGDV